MKKFITIDKTALKENMEERKAERAAKKAEKEANKKPSNIGKKFALAGSYVAVATTAALTAVKVYQTMNNQGAVDMDGTKLDINWETNNEGVEIATF